MPEVFTVKHEMLGLGFAPAEFRPRIKELYSASDKKTGGYITVTVELPKQPGSEEQNRAWHSLIQEYWKSGCGSYDSFEDLRDQLKLRICGAKEYIYLTDRQHTVTRIDDIPPSVPYIAVPKSWRDFDKSDRKDMIDTTIQEMMEAGVNTRKFEQILMGLQAEKI